MLVVYSDNSLKYRLQIQNFTQLIKPTNFNQAITIIRIIPINHIISMNKIVIQVIWSKMTGNKGIKL